MRTIHALSVALALAATSALAPQTCHAGEPATAARAGIDAEIDGVAKAGQTDAVLALTRRVRQEGSADTVLHLVGVLRTRRGYTSVRALGTLADHTDPRVREAVLYAIADLGLRVADAMYDVRAARTDESPSVRAAAYAALGAVGDAADVPALLDDLASSDKEIVRGATDALRGITGATLRSSERLWRQWWKDTQSDAPARLAKAWDVIERGGDATDVADARVVVDRMAWLDLAEAARRVGTWLDSSDAGARSEGYRLAAKLRLGDLSETVRLALRFESDADARRIGRESAAALGVADGSAVDPVAAAR